MIEFVNGGLCAAKGFMASGIHCGIRKNRDKKDLMLLVSDRPASAAGVYTKNLVQGAPILVTQENLKNGIAQAVICNSGNANTCNENGIEIARGMCGLVEKYTGIHSQDVIVASTGVIGQPLDLSPIAKGMPELVAALSASGSESAAQAIMTTDTRLKELAVSFDLGGISCRLGGIAKGSGMIHPNMATMLVFLTTDAAIGADLLKKTLLDDAQKSFHMISVDGDTSTNDTLTVLANGAAGAPPVTADGEAYRTFCEALNMVTTGLCRMIAKDGEGATKLLECKVSGAKDLSAARTAAKSVICSTLVKAAMFGADANWGRVLCALGYGGADVDPQKIGVTFSSRAGRVAVCANGFGIPFDEGLAKTVLKEDEITIEVSLGGGPDEATAWGCDLTYDYVKINGDYRT